jgi:tRNA modification GTPase
MPFDYHSDTIAAISTPSGLGGMSVIRVSGPEALSVAIKCTPLKNIEPRYAYFAAFVDPISSEKIDDVVLIFFKAPASYTGEDVVEISCHGGYAAAPAVLSLLYEQGARPALPGEFTRRAFMNGKMDLLQAEAVADLIHAASGSGQRLAVRTLSGRLSERVNLIHNELKDLAAILELELDFSDQEITPLSKTELAKKITSTINHLSGLADTYISGKILREGALVPIVGRPNTGKSSLMNALLEEERVIISNIPGTTRDTIEESFTHEGLLFRLIDTAGLRETEDPVEMIGNKRARDLLEKADLVLLLVDVCTQDGYEFEKDFIRCHTPLPMIVVYNKIDVSNNIPVLASEDTVQISATRGDNLDDLKATMFRILRETYNADGNTIAITKQRHRHALLKSRDALKRAKNAIERGMSNEYIALDIREAIDSIEEITGLTTSEDILNHIFCHFCIGK